MQMNGVDGFDRGSEGCDPIPHVSPGGGLPIELWRDILQIIDHPKALLACGLTCKVFRTTVQEIISKRSRLFIDETTKTLGASDSTRGYFVRQCNIVATKLRAWLSTHPNSPRLRGLIIRGPGHATSKRPLLLHPQTRFALSMLRSVTSFTLWCIHFPSFSEFARIVCALPDLSKLSLWSVTVDDSRRYSLKDVYFARALHLKQLHIWNFTYNDLHAIWNLLTAPSLSDSLETIWFSVTDLKQVLEKFPIPPALLLSANLRQLKQLEFTLWAQDCGEGCSMATSNLISCVPASLITTLEVTYQCEHSPPHLDQWKRLLCVLDTAVTTVDFIPLRTIRLSLKTKYPFNIDSMYTELRSQSYSPSWREMFRDPSVSFKSHEAPNNRFFDARITEKIDGYAGVATGGIILSIDFNPFSSLKHEVTVVYSRRLSL